MAREPTADGATDADVVVRLVGPFTVVRRGRPVAGADLGSRKARLLLKILSVERRAHRVRARPGRPALGRTSRRRGSRPTTSPRWSAGCARSSAPTSSSGSRETGYRLGNPPAVDVDLDAAERWVDVAEARLAAGEAGLASAAAGRAMDLLGRRGCLEDEPDAPLGPAGPGAADRVAAQRKARLWRPPRSRRATPARPARRLGPRWPTTRTTRSAVRLLMRALRRAGRARPGACGVRRPAATGWPTSSAPTRPPRRESCTPRCCARSRSVQRRRGPSSDVGAESLGLVGRAAELRVLRSRWNAAAAGTGALGAAGRRGGHRQDPPGRGAGGGRRRPPAAWCCAPAVTRPSARCSCSPWSTRWARPSGLLPPEVSRRRGRRATPPSWPAWCRTPRSCSGRRRRRPQLGAGRAQPRLPGGHRLRPRAGRTRARCCCRSTTCTWPAGRPSSCCTTWPGTAPASRVLVLATVRARGGPGRHRPARRGGRAGRGAAAVAGGGRSAGRGGRARRPGGVDPPAHGGARAVRRRDAARAGRRRGRRAEVAAGGAAGAGAPSRPGRRGAAPGRRGAGRRRSTPTVAARLLGEPLPGRAGPGRGRARRPAARGVGSRLRVRQRPGP